MCPMDSGCASVFSADAGTLALFEFNGDVTDSSGNSRDASLIGGTFAATEWGQGLVLAGLDPQGIEWTAHAALLVHPYTVEMVLVPDSTTDYLKLFGFDDGSDDGWYYFRNEFLAYPGSQLGAGALVGGVRHYLAIVSTAVDTIDVYFDGILLGSLAASFAAPPAEAIFFRDDTATSRSESLTGVVEEVRLSGVARTAAEIGASQTRLGLRPYVP